MAMFGSANSEVIKHLEFALNGVQGERGHRLEGMHNDPQLIRAERGIQNALDELNAYQKRTK